MDDRQSINNNPTYGNQRAAYVQAFFPNSNLVRSLQSMPVQWITTARRPWVVLSFMSVGMVPFLWCQRSISQRIIKEREMEAL